MCVERDTYGRSPRPSLLQNQTPWTEGTNDFFQVFQCYPKINGPLWYTTTHLGTYFCTQLWHGHALSNRSNSLLRAGSVDDYFNKGLHRPSWWECLGAIWLSCSWHRPSPNQRPMQHTLLRSVTFTCVVSPISLSSWGQIWQRHSQRFGCFHPLLSPLRLTRGGWLECEQDTPAGFRLTLSVSSGFFSFFLPISLPFPSFLPANFESTKSSLVTWFWVVLWGFIYGSVFLLTPKHKRLSSDLHCSMKELGYMLIKFYTPFRFISRYTGQLSLLPKGILFLVSRRLLVRTIWLIHS